MFNIRPCTPQDSHAVYEVCLKTGDAGQDATHLFEDPKALGHLYAGPYLILEPDLAFVLEDEQGVCGYILGALDTLDFQKRYLDKWLPPLQERYPDPTGDETHWNKTQKIYHQIHHPDLNFLPIFEFYPSHLHIDLLPRAQGQGNGKRMMQTLLETLKKAASVGVHLGLDARNTKALHFYKKVGFQILKDESLQGIYLGMVL